MINIKEVIFAFICINLSIFIINSIGTFNQLINKPYYSPEVIATQFSVPTSWKQIIVPGIGAIGSILTIIAGYTGAGLVILFIAALTLFWEPARWAIMGIGDMASKLGAPQPIVQVINAISMVIWMLFIVEYLGGRRVE